MSVYTVQAPIGTLGEPEPERAVFLREGFSWPAFVFALLWLVWHRLWAIVALWLVVEGLLVWLAMRHFGFGTTLTIALALRIVLGLEGNGLLRRKLAGRRYRLIDVVTAEAAETAERLFFSRLSQPQDATAPAPKDALLGAAMANRDTEVLGVFPLPEERR
ncbi:DUF2628 domain-containing protein [Methylovirgula sp. HY1]|uniref:DUF2628 domain-containing protein n=1 Tax=Methylovirgula sp. HY1 TaxID=2822761 RepID=UPI001C5ABC89|nr:DUF2628 domain-containing protein [Methylovirgula sp. HY1]QXX75798.1 hypothetical protein MHY1_02629 [Methylovirgula sp. HY1]